MDENKKKRQRRKHKTYGDANFDQKSLWHFIKHMVCNVVCIYREIAEFKVTHNKEQKIKKLKKQMKEPKKNKDGRNETLEKYEILYIAP